MIGGRKGADSWADPTGSEDRGAMDGLMVGERRSSRERKMRSAHGASRHDPEPIPRLIRHRYTDLYARRLYGGMMAQPSGLAGLTRSGRSRHGSRSSPIIANPGDRAEGLIFHALTLPRCHTRDDPDSLNPVRQRATQTTDPLPMTATQWIRLDSGMKKDCRGYAKAAGASSAPGERQHPSCCAIPARNGDLGPSCRA
jgi:hypothetical protein